MKRYDVQEIELEVPAGAAFVLHAPPAPLEAAEGALDVQRATLARELHRLKRLLEHP